MPLHDLRITSDGSRSFEIEINDEAYLLARDPNGGEWKLTRPGGDAAFGSPVLATARMPWPLALGRAITEIAKAEECAA